LSFELTRIAQTVANSPRDQSPEKPTNIKTEEEVKGFLRELRKKEKERAKEKEKRMQSL